MSGEAGEAWVSEQIGDYRALNVWKKAMDLAERVYLLTRTWPAEETYGLTIQVRRAAASVAANIAEGQGRTGSREFLHHLSIAHGSLHEVETFLLLAQRLRYSQEATVAPVITQAEEIGRMISVLIRRLR